MIALYSEKNYDLYIFKKEFYYRYISSEKLFSWQYYLLDDDDDIMYNHLKIIINYYSQTPEDRIYTHLIKFIW